MKDGATQVEKEQRPPRGKRALPRASAQVFVPMTFSVLGRQAEKLRRMPKSLRSRYVRATLDAIDASENGKGQPIAAFSRRDSTERQMAARRDALR